MFSPLVWLFWVAGLPSVLALLIRWIYLPIKIRNHHPPHIQSGHTLTKIDSLTSEMRDLIGKYVHQFAKQGFVVGANLTTDRGVKQPRGVQIILINRTTGDVATLILVAVGLSRNCTLMIRSTFASGPDVVTVSNRSIGFFPPYPNTVVARFSWVRDAGTLAEAHRRHLRKLGLEATPRVTPAPGTEEAYSESVHARAIAHFVNCGYYKRDEAAGVLRKTWKGIFLSAWKLTQPVKGWRIRHANWKHRKLWNELGMDQWKLAPTAIEPIAPNKVFAQTAALPFQTDLVEYQTILRPGELRISHDGGAVVVRLGKPGVAEYLLLRIGGLLLILIYVVSIGLGLLNLWIQYLFVATTGGSFRLFLNGSLLWLAAFLIALLLQIRSILRGVRRVRGTGMVSASHHGLHFEAAPSKLASGSIARDDLRNLLVTKREAHMFRSLFELRALPVDGSQPQSLLVATKAATLHEARDALAMAMGIENSIIPPE